MKVADWAMAGFLIGLACTAMYAVFKILNLRFEMKQTEGDAKEEALTAAIHLINAYRQDQDEANVALIRELEASLEEKLEPRRSST